MLILGALAGYTRAADSIWTNASGLFTNVASWDAGVPGSGDSAFFTNNATYTVTFDTSPDNANANFQGPGGTVTLDAGGQAWTLTNGLFIGTNVTSGSSSVTLLDGTLAVTNAGNSGVLRIGLSTFGHELLATNGAKLISNTGGIGGFSTTDAANLSNNLVTVTGLGSVWTNSGFIVLGGNVGARSNRLVVADQGVVISSGVTIGNRGDDNLVEVSGGSLTNNGEMRVGLFGTGHALIVTNQGFVFSQGGYVGGIFSAADSNYATVTGNGSVWTNDATTTITVGNNGHYNQLSVLAGGRFDSGSLTLGGAANANANTVMVTGANSLVNVGDLRVGRFSQSNQLAVLDGGRLVTTVATIGHENGNAYNEVLVSGGIWSNATSLTVGRFLTDNHLIITNQGKVISDSTIVGDAFTTATNNYAIVTGAGSVLSNSANLTVGVTVGGGGNWLRIESSGRVENAVGVIGSGYQASNNYVVVTGSGSLWTNRTGVSLNGFNSRLIVTNQGRVVGNDYLRVGGGLGASNNLVLVTSGGRLVSSNGVLGYFGSADSNQVVVTGSGSQWDLTGDLIVGREGRYNSLTITNGGRVVGAGGAILGQSSFFYSTGNVATVTGPDSLWRIAKQLTVGSIGASNEVVVANQGVLVASNAVIGTTANTSANRLRVTGGSLFVTNGTGNTTFEVRRGTLLFEDGTITADRFLGTNSSESVVSWLGGTANLGGTVISNGVALTVGNGTSSATFNTIGGDHWFGNGLIISSNATLGGTGTLHGAVDIDPGGLVSPGLSIGLLTVQGNLSLSNNAVVRWERDLVTNDVIDVNGTLDFAASLTLELVNLDLSQPVTTNMQFLVFEYDVLSGWAPTGGPTSGLPTSPTVSLTAVGLYTDSARLYDDGAGHIYLTGVWYVPEPAVILMLVLGGGLIRWWWRRRRR